MAGITTRQLLRYLVLKPFFLLSGLAEKDRDMSFNPPASLRLSVFYTDTYDDDDAHDDSAAATVNFFMNLLHYSTNYLNCCFLDIGYKKEGLEERK